MEKKRVIDFSALPISLIIEEIYEVIGELIHLTVVFDNGWEFHGVMTKQSLYNPSYISLVPYGGTLFDLTIPQEEN